MDVKEIVIAKKREESQKAAAPTTSEMLRDLMILELKEIFKDARLKVEPEFIKINSERMVGRQINVLGQIASIHPVVMRRSGTGMVTLINTGKVV